MRTIILRGIVRRRFGCCRRFSGFRLWILRSLGRSLRCFKIEDRKKAGHSEIRSAPLCFGCYLQDWLNESVAFTHVPAGETVEPKVRSDVPVFVAKFPVPVNEMP